MKMILPLTILWPSRRWLHEHLMALLLLWMLYILLTVWRWQTNCPKLFVIQSLGHMWRIMFTIGMVVWHIMPCLIIISVPITWTIRNHNQRKCLRLWHIMEKGFLRILRSTWPRWRNTFKFLRVWFHTDILVSMNVPRSSIYLMGWKLTSWRHPRALFSLRHDTEMISMHVLHLLGPFSNRRQRMMCRLAIYPRYRRQGTLLPSRIVITWRKNIIN
jgi:hypothetical protein